MDLSIIIVNWNTRDHLLRCLESIYANQPAVAFEVMVVDNGSTDGSCEMTAAHFPQVTLIEKNENVGFAHACNIGIMQSKGSRILLLNSDTLVLPGSLAALLRCAEHHADAGIIGARLLNADASFQAGGNDFPNLFSELLLLWGIARRIYTPYFPSYSPEESTLTRSCDWVGGACLMIRRSVIDTVGLLDEGYFMYVEEVDWCYRTRQAGWQVLYCAEAPIVHLGGGSAERTTFPQLLQLYKSKASFLKKRHGNWAVRLFRTNVRAAALAQGLRWYFLDRSNGSGKNGRARVYFRLARASL